MPTRIPRGLIALAVLLGVTVGGVSPLHAQTSCCQPACSQAACCEPSCSATPCDQYIGQPNECCEAPTCSSQEDCCDPFCNPEPSLLFGGLINECTPVLGSLLQRSDHCYGRMISPMTNPTGFEDPRTLTEVRAIFVNHVLPPLIPNAGNQLRVVAAQIRLALTDSTSIIATKDGYIFSDFPLVDDGFADTALGLKQNLAKNADTQRILSAGLTYEGPWGSRRALQGRGTGRFNMFLTGTSAVGDSGQVIVQTGFRLPADRVEGNQLWYASTHLNRRVLFDNLYLFTEFNMYHFMSNGRAFPLPINGGDFFDFGSVGIAGKTMVTGAVGMKLKPSLYREYGLAWEVPLTKERGVLDNRLTADMILRY